MENKFTSVNEVPAKLLRHFISRPQRSIIYGSKGEEAAFFDAKVLELANIFAGMPVTYETDGEEDPVVYLHYFMAGFDWFITERDVDESQLQAFGLAVVHEAELGYINIEEIIGSGAEVDLHWTPKRLSEVKKARNI